MNAIMGRQTPRGSLYRIAAPQARAAGPGGRDDRDNTPC